LLVLASGYLFAALMTLAHGLSFPGLFSSSGLLGAGIQSTAWLYTFWHGGFMLAVAAYAVAKRGGGQEGLLQVRPWGALPSAVLVVIAAAAGLTLLATTGEPLLPVIMMPGDRNLSAIIGPVLGIGAIGSFGLVALWRQRPQNTLDLWLMVVVWASLIEVT